MQLNTGVLPSLAVSLGLLGRLAAWNDPVVFTNIFASVGDHVVARLISEGQLNDLLREKQTDAQRRSFPTVEVADTLIRRFQKTATSEPLQALGLTPLTAPRHLSLR